MSDLFTERLPQNIDKNKVHQVRELEVYRESDDPDFYFIIPYIPKPSVIKKLVGTIRYDVDNIQGCRGASFNMVSNTPMMFEESFKNPNKRTFYEKYGKDISSLIKPKSRIISSGISTYGLTQGDIIHEYLTDVVFGPTHFYHPGLKSMVYPVSKYEYIIEDHPGVINVDTSTTKKYRIQLEKMLTTPITQWPVDEKPNIVLVEDFDAFLEEHKDKKEVAIDTETSGLDFMVDDVGCVTMAFDCKTGYYIPRRVLSIRKFSIWIRDKFQIYQNGKFDLKMLIKSGVNRDSLHIDYDTTQGGHLLNEERSNSLKSQAWIYTNWGGYEAPLKKYIKKYRPDTYLDIPEPILSEYAAMDAVVTFTIYKKQIQEIDRIDRDYPNPYIRENTLKNFMLGKVIPALNEFVDIEYEGAYINIDQLEKQRDFFIALLEECRMKVIRSFRFHNRMNIDSNQEMAIVLERKGYPDIGRTSKGKYSTSDDSLHEWLGMGYPEFESLINYRAVSTIVKMFTGKEKNPPRKNKKNSKDLEELFFGAEVSEKEERSNNEDWSGMWQHLREHSDGSIRVHPSFAVFMKVSLRNGCSSPNLQQIPKHGEYAERVRSIFSAPSSDYYIAELDGRGYQLRIGAALSGDSNLISGFTDPLIGGDVHSLTARNIFRPNMQISDFIDEIKSKNKELSELRHKGKQANLSLEFGSTGYAFAVNTLYPTWSVEEIDKYIQENNLQAKVQKLVDSSSKIKNNNEGDAPEGAEGKKGNKVLRAVDKKFCKYWAVGTHIREKFFEAYPDLGAWVESIPNEAVMKGYVRSVHGAIRRLSKLKYHGPDDDQGYIKNLKNISINSPVQAYENAIISGELVVELSRWLKETKKKTRICIMVHDSVVLYLHKSEVNEVVAKAKSIFERDRIEHFGVPMELEVSIADYSKGQYWGFGKDLED